MNRSAEKVKTALEICLMFMAFGLVLKFGKC